MDTNQNQNQNDQYAGTTPGDTGINAQREKLWDQQINLPVKDLMSRGVDFGGGLADVPFDAQKPFEGITRAVDEYRATQNPDALVLIAGLAKREYVNQSGRTGRDSGHSAR